MAADQVHIYPAIIKEIYLDAFGHVNNSDYLTLFEEARWDWITKNGYGLKKIMETGLGPTILDVSLRFLKELRARDEILIHSYITSYERKIGKMVQKMVRGNEECSIAEFTFGLFSLTERKLVLPTPEWLKGIGYQKENSN
jgi:acyl-CoA thioester hydrolase